MSAGHLSGPPSAVLLQQVSWGVLAGQQGKSWLSGPYRGIPMNQSTPSPLPPTRPVDDCAASAAGRVATPRLAQPSDRELSDALINRAAVNVEALVSANRGVDIAPLHAISMARALWMRDVEAMSTRVQDGEANCYLCGLAITEGPAHWISERGEPIYIGHCCFDLAVGHGVTRWETEHGRPGDVLVPAYLAVTLPPNVQRLPLPRRGA